MEQPGDMIEKMTEMKTPKIIYEHVFYPLYEMQYIVGGNVLNKFLDGGPNKQKTNMFMPALPYPQKYRAMGISTAIISKAKNDEHEHIMKSTILFTVASKTYLSLPFSLINFPDMSLSRLAEIYKALSEKIGERISKDGTLKHEDEGSAIDFISYAYPLKVEKKGELKMLYLPPQVPFEILFQVPERLTENTHLVMVMIHGIMSRPVL